MKQKARALVTKHNKGMTLVEVIIVVAIISILAGGSFNMFGILTGKGARKTADSLTSLIARTKVVTMGKAKKIGSTASQADVYFYFDKDDKGNCKAVFENTNTGDKEEIELTGSGVSVYAVLGEGIDDRLPTGVKEALNEKNVNSTLFKDVKDHKLYIAFSRKDGSLLPDSLAAADSGKEDIYVKLLVIKQANKLITLHITPATGSVWEAE